MTIRIFLFAAAALLWVQCDGQATTTATTPIAKNIPVAEFQNKLQAAGAKATLLDVRTPAEFTGGHLSKAQNINFYDANFKEQVNKLPKDQPVFVYCAVGGRSGQAMDIMKAAGFREVYNMAGGFNAWTAAGKPSVK